MTFWLEVIGWAGSAVLVWSLAQARVARFRALDLAASVVLAGYDVVDVPAEYLPRVGFAPDASGRLVLELAA